MPLAMLPNARVQFLDENGKPLVGGTVGYYEPGTLTPKNTYQDYAGAILNANPLTLDALGSASVFGSGRYRQIVKDILGNLKWDKETVIATVQPYEAGFYWPDAAEAGDIICVWNFTQDVVFPTNFVGSFGSVNTAPSTTTDFDIKINASSAVGTMRLTSGGVVTFSTSISNPPYGPGDRLTAHVQSGGANGAAGIAATFLGNLT